jgi:tRNA A-37 threonylcarbamoyl transferase component Bud32
LNEGAAPTGVGPGTKIAGYRLEEQIGQGGMAVVYRAFDERLERRVALKLLAPSLAADAAFRTRFIRESRAAAAVDHPNIIPVYDAGDAGGFLFISMRFVQGGDVRALLGEGPLAPERAWNIVTQVASALDAAHGHNLVHRDVKPGNMLLDARRGAADGDQRDHVYLSDFGISRQTVASHLTSTGQFVGTLDYIAPEQIEAQEVDGRADQYSLACAAFELLGGGPPFQKDQALGLISAHLSEQPPSLVSRRPDLPKTVDLVLAKAMAKDPAHRYGTCAEFAADLGRALGLAPGQLTVAAAETAMPPAGQEPPAVPTRKAAEPAVSAAAAAAAAMEATVSTSPPPALRAATVNPPGPSPAQPQPQQLQAQQPPAQPAQAQQPQPQWPGAQPGYGPYPGYPPQGPTAPGGGWTTPPPPRRSRGLVVGIVVAVVAVAGAAVAVALALGSKSTGSGGPPNAVGSTSPAGHSPTANLARSEATALNNLLVTSMNNRPAWDSLVPDVANCSNLSFDISQISKIRSARTTELASASGLQVSALTNGASLKADLIQALRLSMRIDTNYLKWAEQQQSTGCGVGYNSSYYQAASNADPQASNIKRQFLALWNPIATTYGFPNLTVPQV